MMAYQCNECNGWTPDSQKHECIYDQFQDLQKENEGLKNTLAEIENPEAVKKLIETVKFVIQEVNKPLGQGFIPDCFDQLEEALAALEKK